MADPISAACLAALVQVGNAISVQTVVGGVLGNQADTVFCKLLRSTSDHFRTNARLPENHDIIKAIIAALKQSLQYHGETLSQQCTDARDRIVADKFNVWVKQDIPVDSDWLSPLANLVTPLIASDGTGTDGSQKDNALKVAVDTLALWIEEGIGELLPERFRSYFLITAPNGRPAWTDVFQMLLREAVKSNDRFQRIFIAGNVAEIAGRMVTIDTVVAGLSVGLAGIESKLSELKGAVDNIQNNLSEQTATLASHSDMLSEMLHMLRDSGTYQRARDEGISDTAIQEIVARAGGEGIARQDMVSWLEAWVDEARAAMAQMGSTDAAFNKARDEAHRRFRDGQLTIASAPLMDLLAAEAAESAQRRERYIRAAIEVDLLAFALGDAIAKIALMATPQDLDPQYPGNRALFYHGQGNVYYASGATLPTNSQLLLAIRLYELAATPECKAAAPETWAAAILALANAQSVLAPRENSNERLFAAVENYGLALSAWSEVRHPARWAQIQCSLGHVWQSIAFRLGTKDAYEAAEAAFLASLRVRSPEENATEWSQSVSGLASLRTTMGLRLGDANALRSAIADYQQMLDIFGDDNAAAHGGLGRALYNLGDVTNDRSCQEQALHHYRREITIYEDQGSIFNQAYGLVGLGNVLQKLHAHPEDQPYLLMAREAHEKAITIFRRHDHPIEWARCMHNIATANAGMAKCYDQAELFAVAIDGFDGALQERRRVTVPLEWARTLHAKASAMVDWDLAEGSHDRHSQALDHYCEALEEIRPDNLPVEWARIWNSYRTTVIRLHSIGKTDAGERSAAMLQRYREKLTRPDQISTKMTIIAMQADLSLQALVNGSADDESSKNRVEQELIEIEALVDMLMEHHKSAPGTANWAYAAYLQGLLLNAKAGHFDDASYCRSAADILRSALAAIPDGVPAEGQHDFWLNAALQYMVAMASIVAETQNEGDATELESFFSLCAEKRPMHIDTIVNPMRALLLAKPQPTNA
jgi:tetratricopeptide (TPR) repeat protein